MQSLGLTLGYFHQFIETHGGRSAFDGLTTANVCTRFVMPMTGPSSLSLVDHIRSQPGGDEYAKPAQWLISHSWSYKFLDVVDAIDNFCQEQELSPDTSFWFCMFANNQHAIGDPAKMFEVFLQAFRTALEDTKKMVMVLSPWHDPETLKRTWCVYEVYLSIVLNARFEIAMGKSQKAAFLDDIHDSKSINRMRAQVNCKNSITTVPTDRDHIFKLIEDAVGGTFTLDRMVFDVMESWVLRTINNQLELAHAPEDRFRWLFTKAKTLVHASFYAEALAVYAAAVQVFRNELPPSFWPGWEAIYRYAEIRAFHRQPIDVWAPSYDEALPKLHELLGPDHKVTLSAWRDAGASYCIAGRYDRGMALLTECYDLEQTKQYDNDDQFLTFYLLGDAHLQQNHVVYAVRWYERAYDGYIRVFGATHEHTMTVQSNLAMCYSKQGRYHQALDKAAVVAAETARVVGPMDQQALIATINLAVLTRQCGDFDQAAAILTQGIDNLQASKEDRLATECIDKLRSIDMWIAKFTRQLGLVHWCQGSLVQAKTLVQQALATTVEISGPSSRLAQFMLLDWYQIRLELADEFASVEAIDEFLRHLEAAEKTDERWRSMTCVGCFEPLVGDLAMCAQCPRLAVCFCPSCAASSPNSACDHVDGPWMVTKPPTRYLLERKLELLAGAGAAYAATAAAYTEYCNRRNITTRRQVGESCVDGADCIVSHAGVRCALAALAMAIACVNYSRT